MPTDTITKIILIREEPGCNAHATLRHAFAPWKVIAKCSCTAGTHQAARAVAKKAGYPDAKPMVVPPCDWNEATNGYTSARRLSAITEVFVF